MFLLPLLAPLLSIVTSLFGGGDGRRPDGA